MISRHACVWVLLATMVSADAAVTITDGSYEDRSQFIVTTSAATYYLDKQGGGLSRLIDSRGRDWIAFHKDPLRSFPASAAAGYRGLGNLVFGEQNPDAGAGHPGFDRCRSHLIGTDTIGVQSVSGTWEWNWKFTDQHVTLTMLKTDPQQTYWFLYEGPVAGNWSPKTHFYGSNLGGPIRDLPDNNSQTFAHWRWAYFGDNAADQTLLAVHLQSDSINDTLWYLGNSDRGIESDDGMIVFGFGRGPKTQPLLQGPGQQFRIGLLNIDRNSVNEAAHASITQTAESWLRLNDSASATSRQSIPVQTRLDRELQFVNQTAEVAAKDSHDPADKPARWRGPQPAIGKPWPVETHAFSRYWFQMGDEFANPITNNRFRVNDTYVATHPEFHDRAEPKSNGMMLIPMKKSPREIDAARLYLEIWGGHPGTDNRRVTINGQSTYPIAVPTEDQCAQVYRQVPIKITDLVRGQNAVQFAVGGENTFWGHFIVEEAAIDVLLREQDESLTKRSLVLSSIPSIVADTHQLDSITFTLPMDAEVAAKIARVDYFARYDGCDENGDGETFDWHGMTKRKSPIGHVGRSSTNPFQVRWDTSMLKSQSGVQVRALIEFHNDDDLQVAETQWRESGNRYWKSESLHVQTAPLTELAIRHPEGIEVMQVKSQTQSTPFWSRNQKLRSCEFAINIPVESIERAQLETAVWDGGAGDVQDYFRLNGHHLPIAANGGHDVILSAIAVDPKWLTENTKAELLSDTLHHGIEVLYPGPSLMIRYRK